MRRRASVPRFDRKWPAATAAIALAMTGAVLTAAPRPAHLQAGGSTPPTRAVFDRYCVTCHNDKLRTAGLSLEHIDLTQVEGNPALWEKLLGKLRTGAMPPPGRPRPAEGEAGPVIAYLETSLERIARANPNPGRPTVHRLNRTEYANAVRDLLSLDVNVASLLPPDDSGGGFDNIADVLSVSPLLLERYLLAARKVSRLAIGDPSLRDDVYRVPRIMVQDERTDEALPLGTRGGMAIRHYFAADGEYLIKVRMQRNLIDEVRGLLHRYNVDVLVDGVRVKTFNIGGDEFEKGKEGLEETYTVMATYLTHADDNMEFRLPMTAGPHVVAATFPSMSFEIEGPPEKPVDPKSWDFYQGKTGLAGIGKIEIRGPYDVAGPGSTPSRRRLFLCQPRAAREERACAEKIISTVARRAFRRPLTPADLQTLLEFYDSGRTEGFEKGVELALQRVLVSPFFLFRVEKDPPHAKPGVPYPLSDLELASRLSFFLWSTIPDDQLLDLASRGQLRKPGVLEREVKRMLADERASALVDNFAAQWLGLRNLSFSVPNEDTFPDFDENLRQAFRRETELFAQSIFREDRSLLDFLGADYTYVNERLARHYGIPNVRGNWFRKVTLNAAQSVRRGILGQGSILTVTSQANRTSPVNRGKWILENVLGTPPPPPPPNVPALNEKVDGKPLSMRQAMETHRRNPVCAACHARLDPLGLALENFNAIGRWRTVSESNEPVDATGELPGRGAFNGPDDLRRLLLGRPEQFVETVAEKLLMYGTGRGLEYFDYPTLRSIVRASAAGQYRASSVVLGIVRSAPFGMRRPTDTQGETKIAAR